MSEELDLTGSKWIPENEIYLVSILESFKDNYPKADIEKEIESFGIKQEDLLDPKNVKQFLEYLQSNFPE
jgi:hypothetical protein